MKRIYLFFSFFLAVLTAYAQDIIVKTDKSEIKSKVLEIAEDVIKYKQFDFLDGPTYNIKKAEVFMVIYKNGKRETFTSTANKTAAKEAQPAVLPDDVLLNKSKEEKNTGSEKSSAGLKEKSLGILDKINSKLPAPKGNAEAGVKEIKTNETPSGLLKNPTRIMVGIGAYKQEDYPEKAIKVAVEYVGLNKKIGVLSGIDNAGIGFASNNMLDMFWNKYTGYVAASGGGMTADGSGNSYSETIYGSKHYLSSYLFKEFDTKYVSFGLLAGPGVNYTRGKYSSYNPKQNSYTVRDIEGGFISAGLHTGQYLHKYLSTNDKGEKNFFIRVGFEQFIMVKGAVGSIFILSFGL